jgi:hypothetical protein
LTQAEVTLSFRQIRGDDSVEELTPLVTALDGDECFALRQLCSTAYLASGKVDDRACAGLVRAKLAWKDRDGYWGATDKGKKVFLQLEEGRRTGA